MWVPGASDTSASGRGASPSTLSVGHLSVDAHRDVGRLTDVQHERVAGAAQRAVRRDRARPRGSAARRAAGAGRTGRRGRRRAARLRGWPRSRRRSSSSCRRRRRRAVPTGSRSSPRRRAGPGPRGSPAPCPRTRELTRAIVPSSAMSERSGRPSRVQPRSRGVAGLGQSTTAMPRPDSSAVSASTRTPSTATSCPATCPSATSSGHRRQFSRRTQLAAADDRARGRTTDDERAALGVESSSAATKTTGWAKPSST